MKLRIRKLTINFNTRLFIVLTFWIGIALLIVNKNPQFFQEVAQCAGLVTLAPFWLVFNVPENWIQLLKDGPSIGKIAGIFLGAAGLLLHLAFWYIAMSLSFEWANRK